MGHKLAIIGYGGMGDWHYKSIISAVNGLEVKGIYDIRNEACNKFNVYGKGCPKEIEGGIKNEF